MDAQQHGSEARFTRRVGLFTVGTLVSRVLGVVRESVFAYLFGAGFATDAFNVAFRIPNFLRDLFAESALSAAFVPTVVQSLNRSKPRMNTDEHRCSESKSGPEIEHPETWRFAANMLNVMLLVVGLLVALGIVFAPQITRLVAMGFSRDPAKLELTIYLTRIMFPFLLFVALAAWAMGILNACGTFFVPAVAPAAFNLVSIVIPLAAYGWLRSRGIEPIVGMAAGVSIGAAAQLLIQYPHLRRHGFRYRPVLDFSDPAVRQVGRRWLPMVLGLSTWQVSFLVNTFLLTFLAEGSVTWVSYAYRIQHLPAGLFGVAIGSVALAEYSHSSGPEAIRDRFRHAMGLVSAFTLPSFLLMLFLAVPIVRLVYEHGRFTPDDTCFTAQALALYSLGIWPAAATRNCAAGFYALGDTRTPALVAVAVVAIGICLNLILMRFIGFRSFPLVTSTVQFLNFLALFQLLRRKTGGLGGRHLVRSTVKVLVASLAGGIAAYALSRAWELVLPVGRIWVQAAQVLLSGCVGLAAFLVIARILRSREVTASVSQLIGRLNRTQPDSSGPDSASN